MRNKYYVILYTEDGNTMTIPVKAVLNEYDGSEQFCGGCPAVFGGTEEKDRETTLVKEVDEESRRTLAVQRDSRFENFFNADKGRWHYYFYSTTEWQETGKEWEKPIDRDEGEMNRVVTVAIEEFRGIEESDAIIDKLLELTGSSSAPVEDIRVFRRSVTVDAFLAFITEKLRR
ncbi:MAG: hypothetical protein GY765_00580 [bacterium]|nr:hypothetical protein [bacterium]